MKLRPRISLKFRIFVSVGAFFLAAVGTLTYLTIRSHRDLLLAQMGERAKAGINLMQLSVTGALYSMDTYRLETIAREAKSLPSVHYAYIFDDKGRIVGDHNVDQHRLFTTFSDALGQKIVVANATLVSFDYDEQILHIAKPITLGHQKLGGIRLGFDLKPTMREMRAVTFRAVAISSAIFLIGLLIIFIITRRMTNPLEKLTLAAKRIEEGDLKYRVSIRRDDEIGTLASAFDQMAERLMQRERELQDSQRVLRRADRLSSLGLLTAGLAHEIRNPLVAIRTFTQLLPERYEDAEFRNGFQGLALKEVDRICGLITDLLSFARPSRRNIAPENINDVVDGITRILETQAREKDVEIKRDFAEDVPPIWVDKEQMKQVFMNLIMNAIQAIKEGGSIHVVTRSRSEPGDSGQFVEIEVRDTGVGIPEENLDHIFDPFFTSKEEGNGLGLSISHQIVQEHGGYVKVKSKVGEGTSFFINLPMGKPVPPSISNGRVSSAEALLH